MAGTLVPTLTFGPTGFVAPPAPAVLTGVQGDISAAFQQTLNFNLNTPQGQIASSEAGVITNTYQTLVNLFQQVDPAYSSGRFQDGIGRIYFMNRNPSVPTVLQVSCGGGTNVPIPFGALIIDEADNLYQCTTPGTIPSGGSVTLPFAAVIPGPTPVPSSNAVSIYQNISGWDTAAVVSGVQGVDVESRAAFETRRQDSVAGNSQGPVGAIIGAVSKVPGVVDYFGVSNITASPVTIFGVTIPANATYISVAGGAPTAVGQAILSKKAGGGPLAGNTTVTVFDSNPLYAQPIPYTITFETPAPIQILWNVTIAAGPNVPSNAAVLVQNALIAAATGQSTLIPPPPKVRIGMTAYAANYTASITSLGPWALVKSILIGSVNTSPTVFDGTISGNTLTVTNVVSGTVAIGQFLFDQDNRIINGTTIISGSGATWTINNPQSVGATFTGSGSGTNLTASAVTGVIGIGDVVTGTGVPANTTILSQTSGTPGGAGVYVTSNSTTASGSCSTAAVITAAVAGSASTPINANQVPQTTAPNIVVTVS